MVLNISDHTGDAFVALGRAGATTCTDGILVPLFDDGLIFAADAAHGVDELGIWFRRSFAGAHTEEKESEKPEPHIGGIHE